ncbi:MAG: hypothetical protein JST08_10275 [Actinobacteria bacterium]|nr:hypothetical protein [Actinomycetota bacterium]
MAGAAHGALEPWRQGAGERRRQVARVAVDEDVVDHRAAQAARADLRGGVDQGGAGLLRGPDVEVAPPGVARGEVARAAVLQIGEHACGRVEGRLGDVADHHDARACPLQPSQRRDVARLERFRVGPAGELFAGSSVGGVVGLAAHQDERPAGVCLDSAQLFVAPGVAGQVRAAGEFVEDGHRGGRTFALRQHHQAEAVAAGEDLERREELERV